MVSASIAVEKLRLMFLPRMVTSSLVLGLSAVVECSSLLSREKPLAEAEATSQRLVPINAGQLAKL